MKIMGIKLSERTKPNNNGKKTKGLSKNKKIILAVILFFAIIGIIGGVGAYNGWFGGGDVIPEDTWTRNLVAYWNFDEGSGTTAYDQTTNNHDGTLTNGPTWSSGKVNGGLSFDGNNDYVSIPDSDDWAFGSGDFSIETWMYIESLDSGIQYSIYSQDNASNSRVAWYSYSATPYLEFYVQSAGTEIAWYYTGPFTPTLNTWYHFALVRSGTNIYMYKNGVSMSLTAATPILGQSLPNLTPELRIGRYWDSYYTGAHYDEYRIYKRALSAAEVQYHYNQGGPIAHYRFEEGTGTTTTDATSNDNDLTLVNTPTWTTSGKFGSALDFESSSSQYGYIADNASLSITSDLTISAWIKPESITAATLFDIAGKWDGASESYLLAQYGDEIRMYIEAAANYVTTNSVNLETGKWYHISAVYNASGQTVKIYVNGKEQAITVSGTIPSSITNDTDRFHIGAEDSSTTAANFYDGIIDDVRVYGYQRTQKEILLDFNEGFSTKLGGSPTGYFSNSKKYPSYRYRMPIAVSGQTTELINKTVFIEVNTAALIPSKMQADCDDIRFTDGDDNQTLDYWIETGECDNAATGIWVETKALTANKTDKIYMYYGNPSASAASSGTNTFLFFDDFSGSSLDTSKWTTVVGSGVSVSGGELTLTGSANWKPGIFTSASFPTDRVITIKVKRVAGGSHWGFTDQNTAVSLNTTGESGVINDGGVNWYGFSAHLSTYNQVLLSASDASYHTWDIARNSSTSVIQKRDGVTQTTHTTNLPVGTLRIGMNTSGSGSAMTADYVFVREYSSTEPTASLGTEESNLVPVAHYRFEEGSGTTTTDATSNDNDLTLVNTPTWTTSGKFGSALDFESTSSQYGYVADSASLSITSDLTISAWIKPESVSAGTYDIAGKWDGASESYLLAQYGDEIRMYIEAAANYVTTSSANLETGKWYHIVAVYDASETSVIIYVNGIEQGTTVTGTIPGGITDDTDRFHIGAEDSSTTATNFYDGIIDDVRVYNSARTLAQVRGDYNEGLATKLGGSPSGYFSNSKKFPSWKYRKPIEISGSADLNRRVLVTVDTSALYSAGKMRNDCNDLRFTDGDDNQTLNYWIESGCNTASTKIWVELKNSAGKNDEYTKLLLHMDGDASGQNHAITFYGDADLNTSTTKWNGSTYFDGTGDYLSIPDSDDWTLGTGNFTIDFWVRFVSNPTIEDYSAMTEQWVDSNNNFGINVYNGKIYVQLRSGAENVFYFRTTEAGVLQNTWHHIAIVRYGTGQNNMYCFLDGVSKSLTWFNNLAADYSIPDLAGGWLIGKSNYQIKELNGYIDEFRISKGIARWTGNFSVPTSPHATDSSTKLLLHMDGDASGQNHATTFNGDADLNTSTTKWNGSTYFDGTGDYLLVSGSDLTLGTGDFTIDMWLYMPSVAGLHTFYSNSAQDNLIMFYHYGTSLRLYLGATYSSVTWNPSESTWFHLAVTRSSGTVYFFLNGTLLVSALNGGNVSSTAHVIGMYGESNDYGMNGYIDDFRVSKGIARWTSTFSVPTRPHGAFNINSTNKIYMYYGNASASAGSSGTSAFTDIAVTSLGSEETSLLPQATWRFEEGSGTTTTDATSNNNDLTLVNTPTWVTGKFGNALDFESTNSQYGYVADSASLSITSDLTISAWIKPESTTAATLFDIAGKWDYISGTAHESYLLAQYGDEIRMYIEAAANYVTTSSANLETGKWYHIVAVYDASETSVIIYVNGIEQGTTVTGTIPGGITDDTDRFHIGAEDSSTTATNFYDGIIDDVRVYNYSRTLAQVLTDYNAGMGIRYK